MARTRPLDLVEIRVLGALLEKEQTTPAYYPMTIPAVIAACNQRSNREPVTDFNETQVVEALDRLRADVLTWRGEGPRSEKWAHTLERRWSLDKPAKAIMTLLMLRGPQTAAELRARSERMHPFASLADVEAKLAALAGGDDPLVRELPRRPGQRETRWIHVVGVPGEEPEPEASAAAPWQHVEAATEPRAARAQDPALLERIDALEAQVAELRAAVEALRTALGEP